MNGIYPHKGIGTIIYDPYRASMKKRTRWWCIVDVDKTITAYYRWWLAKERHIWLYQPSWNAHVSVVRGETISVKAQHLWKKYHNQQIEFTYDHVGNFKTGESPVAKSDGLYYWVDVHCPMLDNIRTELGLRKGWRMHLTFGRTYENNV